MYCKNKEVQKMKVKTTKQEIKDWEDELRTMFDQMERPEVYCLLKNVSRSGMQRTIQLIVIRNNEPWYIGYKVAGILGMAYDEKKEGVKINGCGMDMGFAIVNDLSSHLYKNPDGSYSHEGAYKIKSRWL